MSAACTVWFYSPAKDRVTGLNVINKIVAGLDPPFCHTELQFPSGEDCSIVMQGAVSLRARTFDADFYTPVLLRSAPSAVAAALELARAHVAAGTRFGVLGGRTFCSKLVLDLLCDSGMLGTETLGGDTLAPSLLVTPSSLFRMLQRRQCLAQPLSAISFLEAGTARGAAGASVAAGAAPCFARTAVGFRHEQEAQQKNVPEERLLLLAA
jgi:hypothetical protein